MTLWEFYQDYEMKLAQKFFRINQRGVTLNLAKLENLRKHLVAELGKACKEVEPSVNRPVFPSAKEAKGFEGDYFNLSSPTQVLAALKGCGLKIRKNQFGKEST